MENLAEKTFREKERRGGEEKEEIGWH